MVSRSPLPNWAVMPAADPSSEGEDESEEDELHSTTSKRRKGGQSAGPPNPKRPRLSWPDEKGIGSSSKPLSRTSQLERGNNAAAGSSKPAASIRSRGHELADGQPSSRKHGAGPSRMNNGVEYDKFATSSSASTSSVFERLMSNKDAQSRKGKEKERQPNDHARPLLKSSITAAPPTKPKPDEIIVISSDDDNSAPLPAKPRKSLPVTNKEIIEVLDSDEYVGPTPTKSKAAKAAGSSNAPAPKLKLLKKKKRETEVMRESSSELEASSPVASVPRYVTTKSKETHSQALPAQLSSKSSTSFSSTDYVRSFPSRSAAKGLDADKMDVDLAATTQSAPSKSVAEMAPAAQRMTSDKTNSTGSSSTVVASASYGDLPRRSTEKMVVNDKAVVQASGPETVSERGSAATGRGSDKMSVDNDTVKQASSSSSISEKASTAKMRPSQSNTSAPSDKPVASPSTAGATSVRGADNAAVESNVITPTSSAKAVLERASAALRISDSALSGRSSASSGTTSGSAIDGMAVDTKAVGQSSTSKPKLIPEVNAAVNTPAKPLRPQIARKSTGQTTPQYTQLYSTGRSDSHIPPDFRRIGPVASPDALSPRPALGADKTAVDSDSIPQPSRAKAALESAFAGLKKADTGRSDSSSSVALVPPPRTATGSADAKMLVDTDASGQASTMKSVSLEAATPTLPAKPPWRVRPLPLPLPRKFSGQASSGSSTKATDAPDKKDKDHQSTPRAAALPQTSPGEKAPSRSGPSMSAQPKSPAEPREPPSPEPSSRAKHEPVTPSRVPIPPSPSRRSSGMDMGGLKDVLDTTVPLSPSQPAPSIRPPMVGRQASRTSTSSSSEAVSSEASLGLSKDSKGKGEEKAQPIASSSSTNAKSSRPAAVSLGSSKESAIDLTLDDSDEEMASPAPAPESLDAAIKTSAFLKHQLGDAHTSEAVPPKAVSSSSQASSSCEEKSRAGSDELAMPPQKAPASLPVAPVSPVIPKPPSAVARKPMPLPLPRPGRASQQAPASASTTLSSEAPEAARQSSITAPSPKPRPTDPSVPVRKQGSRSSSSESSSSSASIASAMVTAQVRLPHRTARKSTGRLPRRPMSPSAATSSPAPRLTGARLSSLLSSPIAAVSVSPPLPGALPQPLTDAATPVDTRKPETGPRDSPPKVSVPLDAPEEPTDVRRSVSPASGSTSTSAPVDRSEDARAMNKALPFAAGSPGLRSAEVVPAPLPTVPEPTDVPAVEEPSTATEEDDLDLEYVDVPLPQPVSEDAAEEMDVENLLTDSMAASRDSTVHEVSPDPLSVAAVSDDVPARRRSTRSSRSSSRDSVNYFPDESPIDTPDETPAPSPSPDDYSVPVPTKTWGGFPSLNWRTYRQNLDNFKPTCYFAKDLPHGLQDTINRWPEHAKRHRALVQVLQSAIQENTADDEPDAPPIEIINEVDDEPTPPWEFHYTNKIWLGEGMSPSDMTKLVSCNCMGRCDPKSKTCACVERQERITHIPEFAYDSRGRVKEPDWPIFECNDLCGCGDDCRNRVVQHGRQLPIRIQKTKEKGWGVFAGNKKIQKGTFIGIYAGELLGNAEADARGETYDDWGRTYLFNLDFYHLRQGVENWEIMYAVDAYHAGNFTRFLNHSCNPNCQLVPCYINESDMQKPLLTVFATRDIEPFEEICFSYFGRVDEEGPPQDERPSSPSMDKWKCACKAPNCTGYMFI
ncbi:putative to Structure Of The Set Domain Histone Lysine Methyltransferase Clr4 [Lyophyllum shimeji]|uniref:To Structure Of The Set Domain Histone Lysine Methyltransferase Clr4 n=1 Tax=Lyophyllum shimeji TaxID=47721 RepID=A0A9P3UN34_LYOSH|nr:putative to Structure Of The Set Domain Histone Lysine Methyltransferase Clr4 [Lyophyllum shimeji]